MGVHRRKLGHGVGTYVDHDIVVSFFVVIFFQFSGYLGVLFIGLGVQLTVAIFGGVGR